jgi:hypothetical protein
MLLVALRVEDAQRRKCREKSKGGVEILVYTDTLKTNFGVGLFQFHTKRPGVSGEGF